MASNESKLSIIPLGGLGELGKNMMAIKWGNNILVIDCGLMFPEDEMLGIDVVIPDCNYLLENKKYIRGIVLTHGHEDHIGAIPYIIDELNVPIYGTKLTLGLLKTKLKESKNAQVKLKQKYVNFNQNVNIGPFDIEFVNVSHTISDSAGLIIKTPIGTIVHTGDFKIDQTPVDGRSIDLKKFAQVGDSGVLLLMSDSTNVEREGFAKSESTVRTYYERIFTKAEGRIIVACYASNLHRIQQIIETAYQARRKVAVISDNMAQIIETASKMGRLRVPKRVLIPQEKIEKYDHDKLILLTAGNQGEPLSELTKMALAEHKTLNIIPGDTVVISARPMPGNEKLVSGTIDNFFKQGAKVIYDENSGAYVSGHANQEELKIMLNLVRPKYFIPIHGEYRQLVRHGRLAQSLGIEEGNIFVIENGQVVDFTEKGAALNGRVHAGKVLVDGFGVGDVGNIVLRDRKQLSQDGILIAVITINKKSGAVVSGPDLISRGFVYVRESEKLMEEAHNLAKKALVQCQEQQIKEWSAIKTNVKDVLGKYLYEKTRRRPMIMPIIMEV
ncbi:ribonuclease J [Desulfitispora alkaliphila]|uniref:ribonuclease J n=1 Tax=Desulfitispora alkaliphila TaxID=622674 RepID=UPI003D236A8A